LGSLRESGYPPLDRVGLSGATLDILHSSRRASDGEHLFEFEAETPGLALFSATFG
jgi:hypothetical protein